MEKSIFEFECPYCHKINYLAGLSGFKKTDELGMFCANCHKIFRIKNILKEKPEDDQ